MGIKLWITDLLLYIYNNHHMKILNEQVRIIKCEHKSGTSKANKPYSMYVLEVVDEQYNKFQVTVPRNVLNEGVVPEWLLEANDLEVTMDFEVVPQGYGVAVRCTEIKESN